MDIKNYHFTGTEKDKDTYHSQIFGRDFPLLVKNRSYVKLGALSKPEIRRDLPDFLKRLPGKSHNVPFLDSDEFYEDPSQNQIYTLRSTLHDGKLLYLFFRNTYPDPSVDSYFEALQESLILRQSADCSFLDELTGQRFHAAYNRALKKSRVLAHQGEQEFSYFPKKAIESCLKKKIHVIFDALGIMQEKGHPPKDVLDRTCHLRIEPIISFRNDFVLENIMSYLKS